MIRPLLALMMTIACTSILAADARLELVAGPQGVVAPFGTDFDSHGTLYFVEMAKGERLRSVTNGTVTTLAGTGEKGTSGDGGAALRATFNGMHSLAVGADDRVYLADTWNNRIRVYDPQTTTVRAFAGTGTKAFSGDGGPAAKAEFGGVFCIAFNPAKTMMVVTDLDNRRIRKIDLKTQIVTTIAGNGKKGLPSDGKLAVEEPLVDPRAAILADDGTVYILERSGHALRKVDAKGVITTVVGTGKAGREGLNGPALKAALNGPKHLCFDHDGSVVIADTENHRIARFVPSTGALVAVAGVGTKGADGVGGPPLAAQFNQPHGVTIHPKTGELFISDSSNGRVLKITK
jgi:DNA-binding beta-propeller fold protein YncE